MYAVPVIDAVALVAFATALALASWLAIANRGDPELIFARVLFAVAMALYTFVSFSNLMEHLEITAALDPVEDYLEILFVPLMLYISFAYVSDYERRRLKHAYDMLDGQHNLLERVVETSPTGIIVTDLDGRITFANERAKAILCLGDDMGRPDIPTPGWRLRDLAAADDTWSAPGRFLLAAIAASYERDTICVLEWPDGRRTLLETSASGMLSKEGEPKATVFSIRERASEADHSQRP